VALFYVQNSTMNFSILMVQNVREKKFAKGKMAKRHSIVLDLSYPFEWLEFSSVRHCRKKNWQLIRLVCWAPLPEIELSRRDAILRDSAASAEKKSQAKSREGRNFVNRVAFPLEGVGASVHHIDRGGGRYPACLYTRVYVCIRASCMCMCAHARIHRENEWIYMYI